MNPKVSVIIPVYNTAPYLRRCLDSVCNQTLRDIEIICVDDASTDNSLGILNEYAARDKRIRIIPFSENRGECAARNAALDIAAGEYMGGCDSDDYIDLNFYKSLLDGKRVGGGEADIVYADHFIIHGKDGKTRKSLQTRYRIHHAIMLCKIALLRQFSIDYPEELRVGGDSVFFCKLYKYADAMKKINVTDTYHYYIYENSLSNSAITREKILIHKQMYEMLITLLNSFGEQKIECALTYFVTRFAVLLSMFYCDESGNNRGLVCLIMMDFYNNFKYRLRVSKMLLVNEPAVKLINCFDNNDVESAYFLLNSSVQGFSELRDIIIIRWMIHKND